MGKRKSFLACLLLMVLGSLCACGRADISAYENAQITVLGVGEEAVYTTPKELQSMKCQSLTVSGKTSGDKIKAYGPTLETFLANYDLTYEEVRYVTFRATDEYHVTLATDRIEDETIILSIAGGSEPLGEDEQPLRLVSSGNDSSQRIRMVNEIEITLWDQ